MSTKQLFLTAFAVAALLTASFANVFSSDNNVTLKCYDDASYYNPDDSTNNTDGYNGGGQTPPIGR